jgi:hypothetical protein
VGKATAISWAREAHGRLGHEGEVEYYDGINAFILERGNGNKHFSIVLSPNPSTM